MAARRRKKTSSSKNLIIALAFLAALQAGFIFLWGSGSQQMTVRDAITRAVSEKKDLSPQRREQLKIQLAIADFQTKHNGTPPAALRELVPVYFDQVPLDPETNQAFPYRVEGTRYILGPTETSPTTKKGVSKDGPVEGMTEQEEDALIAMLTQSSSEPEYIYDSTGKRDPFMPFDFSPKIDDPNKTPLELYSISQLKLTAVLGGMDEATAIVENNAGKGFTVRKGTKIGPNSGEVVEILPDKLLILETEVDFTGQTKTRTVEMRLRTKEEEERGESTVKRTR